MKFTRKYTGPVRQTKHGKSVPWSLGEIGPPIYISIDGTLQRLRAVCAATARLLLLLAVAIFFHQSSFRPMRPKLLRLRRGVARNLFRRGTKPGDWGQKSPSGVHSRGRALVGVWGQSPQKRRHMRRHMRITIAIMC